MALMAWLPTLEQFSVSRLVDLGPLGVHALKPVAVRGEVAARPKLGWRHARSTAAGDGGRRRVLRHHRHRGYTRPITFAALEFLSLLYAAKPNLANFGAPEKV